MKKRTKITLLVCAAAALLGCVLIGLGLGCGAHRGVIWDRDGLRTFDTRSDETREILTDSLENFQTIDLRISSFDQTEIVSSDHFGIEIDRGAPMKTIDLAIIGNAPIGQTPSYSVSNGTLSVTDSAEESRHICLLANLDFFRSYRDTEPSRVTIFVPADVRLGGAVLDCDGRVSLNGPSFRTLQIDAEGINLAKVDAGETSLTSRDGSVALEQLTAQPLSVQNTSASTTLQNVTVAGELKDSARRQYPSG